MIPESAEQIPFIGPRPFEQEHKDLFFGRDNEANELLSLVIAHRVLLFYAQSGAGKTSLLNAGFIPILEEEGFEVLPLARVSGEISKDINPRDIPNIYIFNVLTSLAKESDNKQEQLLKESLVNFLQKREHLIDKEGLPSPRVVIFDQFEELFISYPDRWKEREGFIRHVVEALEADPLLRVVFTMREDYIAQLDPYTSLLPEKLRTRYRLERLHEKAALSAVEGPVRGKSRSFAEGVASKLVQQLLSVRFKRPAEETLETEGEYVEPVQLQVVCQNLWVNMPTDEKIITADHLQEFGDVDEALKNFYEKAIETAVKKTGVDKRDIRRWFNEKLITPAGTRGTVFRDKENTEGMPNKAVDVLEDVHIVRAEMRAGARWYELTHDRLIEPIRKTDEEWLKREREKEHQRQIKEERERAEQAERLAEVEAKRAEAERERAKQAELLAEVEARSARRFRRLTAALAVVSIVALALAVSAVYLYLVQRDTSDKLEMSLRTEQDLRKEAEALSKDLKKFLTANIDGFIKELIDNPLTRERGERLKQTWEEMQKKIGTPQAEPTYTQAELERNLIVDLRDLIEAHNEILQKLNVVDKPEVEVVEKFTQLYEKLKDLDQLEPFFEETSSFSRDFEELKERIQKLQSIREENNPESLVKIAQTAEHTEAIYAAWKKLGELPGSQWMSDVNDVNDLKSDRKIRDLLKDRFESIRHLNEAHGNSLLQTLIRTGLKYEIDFIERKNRLQQDKVLVEFYTFALVRTLGYAPSEFEDVEVIARDLADFVSIPGWSDKFLMNPPTEGNPLYTKTDLIQADFASWLNEAKYYKKLEEDPRQQYRQDKLVQEVRGRIDTLRPNLPDQASKFQQTLNANQKRINELLQKPAIVKNKTDINKAANELKGIGQRLATFKKEVDSYIFKPWCANVSIVKGVTEGKYIVVLKSEQLRDKFLPLKKSNKQPIEVDQGSFEGLVREDFTDTGWPNYISSIKDPNVILKFIPAGADNPKPFYMATHEITYAQYAFFLQQSGSKRVGYDGQSKFGAKDKAFISWTEIDYPLCPIELKDQTFDVNNYIGSGDLPVTYVTYNGAESYAVWLGGQLPDAKQHRYACQAGTTSRYFWGENISDILKYAHVRADPWRQAAQMYNEKKDRLSALAVLPIGAVKSDEDYMKEPDPDPLKNKELILNIVIAEDDPNSPYAKRSAWPMVSSTKPNNWGLYDMIGNVWEWCQDGTQPVICGGSCLAPPECITDDSMYSKSLEIQYQGQQLKYKDIGFRVAVPAI